MFEKGGQPLTLQRLSTCQYQLGLLTGVNFSDMSMIIS